MPPELLLFATFLYFLLFALSLLSERLEQAAENLKQEWHPTENKDRD